MKSESLLALIAKFNANSKSGRANQGLESGEALLDLKKNRKTETPAQEDTDSPTVKKRSTRSYLRQYGPMGLAALLGIGGAYLGWKVGYKSTGSILELVTAGQHSNDLVDKINLMEAQDYADATVHYLAQEMTYWPAATANITIYNGNHTDWCWPCMDPNNYQLGAVTSSGSEAVDFLSCPGVLPTPLFQGLAEGGGTYANPARDLQYTENDCQAMFNFFNSEFQSYDPTGKSYFDYFLYLNAPDLNPNLNITRYTPSPAVEAGSYIGGGLFALATYGMGLIGTMDFVTRWINAYRNHPTDVLPGKRNALLTTVTMGWTLLQSMIRGAPVLISGWMDMQEDNVHPALMWTTISMAIITSVASYFAGFDEVYGHFPKWLGNDIPYLALQSYNKIKGFIGHRLGWTTTDTQLTLFGKPVGQLVFPQRDKLLFKMIKLIEEFMPIADPAIIRALGKRYYSAVR